MTKNEFNIGDRVSVEDSKCSGIVTAVDGMRCLVRFDNGRVMNFPKGVLQHRASHIPKDRKTAFLTELQSLLKSHNATIQSYMSGVDTVGLCICFGDKNIEEVDYQHNDTTCEIDADNIMDFDKE